MTDRRRFLVVFAASLFVLSSADDVQVKVRLDGIDAPEKNQSFGTKSKDALAGLVFGKTVTVQSKGTDRYGRTLGVISVGAGLWADANPLPPWDFRARKRSGTGSATRPSKFSHGTRTPA